MDSISKTAHFVEALNVITEVEGFELIRIERDGFGLVKKSQPMEFDVRQVAAVAMECFEELTSNSDPGCVSAMKDLQLNLKRYLQKVDSKKGYLDFSYYLGYRNEHEEKIQCLLNKITSQYGQVEKSFLEYSGNSSIRKDSETAALYHRVDSWPGHPTLNPEFCEQAYRSVIEDLSLFCSQCDPSTQVKILPLISELLFAYRVVCLREVFSSVSFQRLTGPTIDTAAKQIFDKMRSLPLGGHLTLPNYITTSNPTNPDSPHAMAYVIKRVSQKEYRLSEFDSYSRRYKLGTDGEHESNAKGEHVCTRVFTEDHLSQTFFVKLLKQNSQIEKIMGGKGHVALELPGERVYSSGLHSYAQANGVCHTKSPLMVIQDRLRNNEYKKFMACTLQNRIERVRQASLAKYFWNRSLDEIVIYEASRLLECYKSNTAS